MTSATCLSQPNRKFDAVRRIMQRFITDMAYIPLTMSPFNEELEDIMVKTMDSRNIRCKQLENTLHLAASFIQLCYPDISLEEKRIASLFNWFLIYADDQASRNLLPFRQFEQRFIRGLPQLDPVLDALVDVLHEVWEKWDDLTANFIISSAVNFMTFCCVESALDRDTSLALPRNSRFAWFLREGSGIAKPYSIFGFTKSKGLGITDHVHVLPDMDYWVALTNDVLSFYKEEFNGDTNNYIHVRARNENKTAVEILSDVEEELTASRDVIHSALASSPLALKAWIKMEQGYIHWHLTQERYKLSDLRLIPHQKYSKGITINSWESVKVHHL